MNIHYDICALIILCTIAVLRLYKKSIPITKNTLFALLTLFTFISALTDLLSGIGSNNPGSFSSIYMWIVNLIYFIATQAIPVIFLLYCISFSDKSEKRNKNTQLLLLISVPFIIDIILILLSPIYNIIFTIDSNNEYNRQPGVLLLYLILFYYMCFICLVIYKTRYIIGIQNSWILCLYLFISLVSTLLQLIFPELLIQSFGIALSLLFISIVIQKPEELTDSTTGLFNQTAFTILFQKTQRKHPKVLVATIVIDDINFLQRAFGVNQIQSLLKNIASFLRQDELNASVYSFGAGRFCMMLPLEDLNIAESGIQKIISRLNMPWNINEIEIRVVTRVCLINCPDDAKTAEDINDYMELVAEDIKYKQQKKIYARNIDTFSKRRTVYIDHLVKRALQDGLLSVYYQPIYSTAKNRIIGAEALIRMRDENGVFISPEEFIPIAEKNGSILRIGEYVFENVCKTLSEIDVDELEIEKIDINLSVVQCMQNTLSDQILSIAYIYKIPSRILNLEITETAAANSPKTLLENMERLAAAGIELSLDDYGSGYSNMNYMLELPFKMIKIDKGIIWAADKEERANTALRFTVSMIKALKMTVLAEGVETKDQLEWLSKIGIDYIQGYYFSKPIPKDDFLQLLEKESLKNSKASPKKNNAKQYNVITPDDDLEILTEAIED